MGLVFWRMRVTSGLLGRLRAPRLKVALGQSDVDALFKVQPRRALAYFRARRPGSPLEDEFLEAAKQDAFTMARATSDRMLNKVHRFIEERIKTGDTEVDPYEFFEDLGVDGAYGEMVVRTNVNDVYNQGYYDEVAGDEEVAPFFPGWEYLVVDDDRLGDDHRVHLTEGINGTAFYPRETTFDEVRGDRVFNCRCGLRWVDKWEWQELGLPA